MIFIFVLFSCFVFLQSSVSAAKCPGLVSKKEWDGLTPHQVNYLPRPVSLVIIQHTVSQTCNSDASCKNIVQGIQNTQINKFGLWDISANFLVGGNGKVYEGSGWLHVGGHTYGYNSRSIGISFIGNFEYDDPTPEALEAAQALIKCGVEQGHLTPDYHVVAHKKLIATDSPGRNVYQKIRTWPHYLD